MTEFWFDTRDGKLLAGDDAVEPRLMGSGPGDVMPLNTLLRAKEFPYTLGEFEKQNRRGLTREDYLQYGGWVLNVLNGDGKRRAVSREVIRRLYILGLGPNRHGIESEKYFNGFANFQSEIGSKVNVPNNYWDSWDINKFVEYAKKVRALLGRMPTEDDYNTLAGDGVSPNYQVMLQHLGGISDLHEHLGHPNIRTWENEEYIDYGARVAQINGPENLTVDVIDILAAKKRGPWLRNFVKPNRFNTWKNFKAQALAEYYIRQAERQAKIDEYKTLFTPDEEQDMGDIQDADWLRIGGRYKLLEYIVPGMPRQSMMRVLKIGNADFIRSLKDTNAGELELAAIELGVFDDIWPPESDKYLKVSDKEIEIKRAGNRERKRRNFINKAA